MYEVTYYNEYSLDHVEYTECKEKELADRISYLQGDGHTILKVKRIKREA